MRTSQAESIREPLEQAINAINDFFGQLKKSEQSATEFEKIFTEGISPATGRKLATRDDRREDLRTMLGLPRGAKKALEKYLAQEEAMMLPRITRPRISSYYPWRHRVAEAISHLAKCGWTTEAEAVESALNGLPKDNGTIDWTQPGTHQEIRAKVIVVANRIRDVLTACIAETAKAKGASINSELSEDSQRLVRIEAAVTSGAKLKKNRKNGDELKAKKKEVEKDLCIDWETFRDREGGTKEKFLKQNPEAAKQIREYFRDEMKQKNIDVLTMLMRIIERNRN